MAPRPALSRRAPRSLAPLRHRGFRLLMAGQLASNVGDACYAVALPWFVLAEHGGVLLLGAVLGAYGIPRTALLVVGGHARDRWRPWTVMMASDTIRALAVAALAVAASLGPARAVILVPIAAVLGGGAGLFLPCSFAIVPALLPDQDLQAGNALTSSGTQLAMLAGPAAGGALVALLGPGPAFALDAASFVISAATLAGVRRVQRRPSAAAASPERSSPLTRAQNEPQPAAEPARSLPRRAGLAGKADQPAGQAAAVGGRPGGPGLSRLLRSERVLQIALLITVATNLGFGGMSEVALPALAHGPLHTGAGGYGALIAAFAAGALLGTVAAGQLRRVSRPVIAGSVACLGQAVFMAAVPYLGSTVAAGAALVVFGALNGFGNVVMITAFQRWAPPALLGRLAGLLTLASLGVFPISVALGAIVVHDLGPAPFFLLTAATLAAAILVGLSQRTWRAFGAVDRCAAAADPRRTAAESRTSPVPGRREHDGPSVLSTTGRPS